MRILHCIHSLSGGGAETQLAILSREMHILGCSVAIFYVDGVPPHHEGVEYFHCEKGRYPFRLVGEIRKVVAYYKPDIIHAWLPATINIAALIAGSLAHVPVLSSIRNRRQIDGLLRLVSFISTWILADMIVTNNAIEQSSMAYQRLFHAKNGLQINNAVVSPEEQKHRKCADGDAVKFLFVGRLTKQKNLDMLIKALGKLRENIRFQLDIYGVGELEQWHKDEVENNGLCDMVVFKGYRNNVVDIMHKYDVLVLPSIYEGMPNVVVEALAAGLPALVSDIPAHTKLFTNNEVRFFESCNEESLVECILDYLRNTSESEVMLNRSRDFIASLNPHETAKKYVTAYNDLIEKWRSRGH